jgi:hypothetical protein
MMAEERGVPMHGLRRVTFGAPLAGERRLDPKELVERIITLRQVCHLTMVALICSNGGELRASHQALRDADLADEIWRWDDPETGEVVLREGGDSMICPRARVRSADKRYAGAV